MQTKLRRSVLAVSVPLCATSLTNSHAWRHRTAIICQRCISCRETSSSSNPTSPRPSVGVASPGYAQPRQRTFSRASRSGGSAYGYGGARNRLCSTNTAATWCVRRPSGAPSIFRCGSSSDGHGFALNPRGSFGGHAMSGGESTYGEMDFAQRLLMAKENVVMNIADLWVVAAMNVDNEDPFVSDDEEETGAQACSSGMMKVALLMCKALVKRALEW
ncbi:hypothetical protein HGRIS_001480 [Hohenbuehelia grisea]|uniref:Uncharacterized protein n=1 Tax=Hohenbuehelia grisea TaxID=104357 RepID=A0ABR3IPA1_9AGAR